MAAELVPPKITSERKRIAFSHKHERKKCFMYTVYGNVPKLSELLPPAAAIVYCIFAAKSSL
jgi:hypothetical protein